jgi:uncharacterized membrane protein
VAVALLSALAVGMWAMRAHWTQLELSFLVWNLFLAWIPWVAAVAFVTSRSPLACALTGGTWLLFLPNAPYLVTDLIHLQVRPNVPLWFDILLFAAFALSGCALAWASIEAVHARLARSLGLLRSAGIMLGVLFLTGFGVYLGRFLRWNSWDVVAQPGALLADVAASLATPRALVFSSLFGAFVGAGYLVVCSFPILPQAYTMTGFRRWMRERSSVDV